MSLFHPWRRLRGRPEIDLVWSRDITVLGMTDGQQITMRPDQMQVERRCTLAHELAHVELGHRECCDGRDEARARALAARWLIPIDSLLDALAWTQDWWEAADHLWVDLDTLRTRIDHLDTSEREALTVKAREMGEIR